MRHFYKPIILLLFALSVLAACNGSKSPERTSKNISKEDVQLIKISEPTNGTMFALGETFDIVLKQVNDSLKPDSIILFVDNNRIANLQDLNYLLSTDKLSLGARQIRATAWHNGSRQTASVGVRLRANKAPSIMKYRVKNSYPHDIEAYTQGLFYHNGKIIESTGQKGFSSLRRVDLKTGKVLQSVNLDRQYFGEGATYINGEIYQITWTSRKGFVYDPKTFDLIRTFDYLTQGWGLTTKDDMLIMSDGSNILYFLEPKSFSEIKRVEVYNHQGPINQLNELEYINGKVWANIYQTEKVVIIDPQTGQVEAEIDFSGLLSEADKHRNIDVFNGIAWDEENQRLFVTGKNWPKLFEVEVY